MIERNVRKQRSLASSATDEDLKSDMIKYLENEKSSAQDRRTQSSR